MSTAVFALNLNCLTIGCATQEETQWTQEKRKQLPLQFKLESLIMRLYDNFCDFEFKKQNPRPEKSFFWKDPNESEFELVD